MIFILCNLSYYVDGLTIHNRKEYFYIVDSDFTSTSWLGSIHEGCVWSSNPGQSNGNNSSAIKCGRIEIKGAKVIWNLFEVIDNATCYWEKW